MKYISEKENLNECDLRRSLMFLSKLLYTHFRTVVWILIDEYDSPLNYLCESRTYSNFVSGKKKTGLDEDYRSVSSLLSGMFGAALQSYEYTQKGIMMGIIKI